jgi:hypothetical protein
MRLSPRCVLFDLNRCACAPTPQVTFVARKSSGQTAINLVAQIFALLRLVLTASTVTLRLIEHLQAGGRCPCCRGRGGAGAGGKTAVQRLDEEGATSVPGDTVGLTMAALPLAASKQAPALVIDEAAVRAPSPARSAPFISNEGQPGSASSSGYAPLASPARVAPAPSVVPLFMAPPASAFATSAAAAAAAPGGQVELEGFSALASRPAPLPSFVVTTTPPSAVGAGFIPAAQAQAQDPFAAAPLSARGTPYRLAPLSGHAAPPAAVYLPGDEGATSARGPRRPSAYLLATAQAHSSDQAQAQASGPAAGPVAVAGVSAR